MNKQSVFLYGPSGAGKSAVGKILAEKLQLPFIDLDEEIESQSGITIPEIFADEGEKSFREKETRALRNAVSSDEKVIALGGGALINPMNRHYVESSGKVILLHTRKEILLERLGTDKAQRPLLAGEPEGKLSRLLAQRQGHYDSFPLQIDTSDKSPKEVSWEIQVQLGMFHLHSMATHQNPGYDVRVQAGLLDQLGEMLKQRSLRGPIAVVTDEHVGELYLAQVTKAISNSGFETHGITIPAGEAYKTLETVSKLWDAFLCAKIERGSTVVALGGGVVGDLAGFAAGTFLRGVPWVAVPTTLLAMVDASLGGKTGADLPQAKNLIGAFNPPRLVLADPEILETLPKLEIACGMAEVVKHGVIADPRLLDLEALGNLQNLEKTIRRAMAVKIRIIEQDPYEKGIRATLNYGHTVGHGVELVSGFNIHHGEAVAIGMVIETQFAEQIGIAKAGLSDEVIKVLQKYGLPTMIPTGLDRVAIIEAMQRDKKKADGIVRFALPAKIGDVRVGIEVEDWEALITEIDCER